MTHDVSVTLVSTRIDLSANARRTVAVVLQGLLIDATDLRLCVKQAHWTVRGPTFNMLHAFFESCVAPLDEAIDEIAERIATLGGVPDGLSATVARGSRLAPYPAKALAPETHLGALGDRFATLANQLRADISEVEQAGDAASADLLTGLLRQIDKSLWQLEAHTTPDA